MRDTRTSRLAVGTAPIAVAAALTLTAMSAFVVMNPMARSDQAVEHASAATRTEGSESRSPRSADAVDGGGRSVTTTRPMSVTTTAAHRSTTTTEPGSNEANRDAQLASTPISLPGREVVAPMLQRRIPTMSQVLRPDTRLFGVHTPQAPFANSEMASFATAADKTPNTVLFFQNFSESFPEDAVDAAWTRGMLPMITFEPIVQNSTEGQPTLADINNGAWDDYFTAWADAAKGDGRPIAFRFAQEMNGDWYPWSDARFGNAPGSFVTAWRHVHDLFDAAGVTNVVWIWSINRIDNLPDTTLARVYPGDDYVDWIGISGYLRTVPDGVEPSFDDTFGRTLAALHTLAPDKLVMLTEVGAGTTESDRVNWMASFFQGLLDHPEIIGFNWFNAFKNGGDLRIQYSEATSAAFAEGVADDRYGVLAPTIPVP